MRFTGQVKIPDLDYPGVPASVQVDGKQIELFVEGESLGRWSLVDVRAERLISSAFSLKLAGEEVTFIADQPTEFAYGGVEAMANVWAKHKSMRLPLRVVANSRSRQGTKPSRIPDLRDAIEETLAGASTTGLDPARPPGRREASGIASLREATGRKEPDAGPSVPDDAPSPIEDRAVEPEPPTQTDPEEKPVQRDPVPDSPDTPDAVFAEPESEQVPEPSPTDSVFKQSVPWAKSEEAETEAAPDPGASVPPAAASAGPDPAVPESALPDEPDHVDQPDEPEETPEPAPPQTGSVPWLAPTVDDDPPAAAPGPASEPFSDDVREVAPIDEPEPVVDPAAYEDDEVVAVRAVEDDEDDASEQVAPTAARGGIMGAVRSAFVRNRVEHTHDYVEAPGGLGIKRQICAECGHISIGVQ